MSAVLAGDSEGGVVMCMVVAVEFGGLYASDIEATGVG